MRKAKVTRSVVHSWGVPGHLVLDNTPDVEPVNTGKSMTEPNQVQDLKTLLVGRNRGIMPTFFNGRYSEYSTEDIQKMDFVELRDYRERVAERESQLKDEFKAITNQMEQRRAQELEARLDAAIAAKETKSPSPGNTSS